VAELTLKQVRSANGASPKQRGTLASLRLGRIGRTATMTDTPQLRGALARVAHLVEVTSEDSAGGGDGRASATGDDAGGRDDS
jgi:large subunit ribosomal protein L30